MNSPRSQRSRSISFRLTALIDMAFLLITFFVMSIRFGQVGEEEIELPRADQASEVTDERVDLVTVNVARDGAYAINAVRHDASELTRYLEERKADSDRTIELVIRGDRRTRFEPVQRALRVAAEVGIPRVSLAALQLGDEGSEGR